MAGALMTAVGVVGVAAGPAVAQHKDSHDPPGKADNPGQANRNGNANANANASPGPRPKIVVCKFVTTPGGSLHHVIIVSENSLRNTGYSGSLPYSWTDAHGKSLVGSVAKRYATAGEKAHLLNLQAECGSTPPPGEPLEVSPSVTFTDPDCDNLSAAGWDGSDDAIVDYDVTGTPGLGKTVSVAAAIDPDRADDYVFADGAKTRFSHTFPTVAELGCVLGEQTVIPKPKPEDEPTVKGAQALAPVAAPTAVAAGAGDTAASPLQTVAQMLVAGGMLLLVAGAWIGLGRRESGTHEA